MTTDLGMFDWVMLTMLVAFAGTALLAWWSGNEQRDVKLLSTLGALWGAVTALVIAS